MKKLLTLAVLLTLSLTIAACGKKKEEQAAQSAMAKTSGAQLLEYVPADSPYLYAALEPSPEAVREKLQPLMDATIPVLRSSLEAIAGVMEKAANEGEGDTEAAEQASKVLDALIKRMTPDMGKKFGFSAAQSVAVFYGHGIVPVARVTLADPDQFRREFAAMTAEMELEFEQTNVESITYDRIPVAEAVELLVAQDGDMLIVTITPPGFGDDNIAMLLGAEKPDESMAGSSALQALADKYEYLPQGLGWIDMQAIAGIFIDGPTGMNKALFDSAGPQAQMPALSDICKKEASSLAAIAPRLTIGYTRLDTSGFDMLPVMELRGDVARGMLPVAGKVPGMTAVSDSLMKFGLALDLKALRGYVEERVAAISETPFECPELAQINMAAAQADQALQQPLPPIAYNFKGFYVDVEDFEGIDFSNPSIPEELNLSMLLAFDNVNALLQMGQMMLPPLAAIEIQPDGEPVTIPQEMLPGYTSQVFAAMGDNLLAIGSGDGSDDRVSSMVKTTDAGEPVIMAMSVDLAEYTRLMNDMQTSILDQELSAANASDEEKEAKAMIEATLESNRKLQEVYAELFGRETILITITENGFELPTTITLQ